MGHTQPPDACGFTDGRKPVREVMLDAAASIIRLREGEHTAACKIITRNLSANLNQAPECLVYCIEQIACVLNGPIKRRIAFYLKRE